MRALLAAGAAEPSFVVPGTILVLMFTAFVSYVVYSTRSMRRNGFRAGQQPPFRSMSHEFGPESRTWRGGGRIGRLHASLPLASLTADAEVALIKVVSTPVWIRHAEVTAVRSWSHELGFALMFDTPDGLFDGVAFFTMNEDVVSGLGTLGWPVAPVTRTPPLA